MAVSMSKAQQTSPSMLVALSEFAANASTLEKSLRLAHALSWTLVALSRPRPDAGLLAARGHLAVSRRFFRLLKWVDTWSAAAACFDELRMRPSTIGILAFAKQSLLALYFFTEMLALPWALGLSGGLAASGPRLQLEADRFWLYALLVSLLLGILELASLYLAPASSGADVVPPAPMASPEKQDHNGDVSLAADVHLVKRSRVKPTKDAQQTTASDEKAAAGDRLSSPTAEQSRLDLVKGIVADACDTLIPASSFGIVPFGELGIGIGMSISTIIPLRDMWLAMQLE